MKTRKQLDPVKLVQQLDPDRWTLGDAQDLVAISGVGFDVALDIVGSGNYQRLTPGLLVAVLTIEGRRSGYTTDDVRALNLAEVITALAALNK